jgi:hypothetical protein
VRLFTLLLLVSSCPALAADVLWRDPGPVESLDLHHGKGGVQLVPKPPFVFLNEEDSGTTPKVRVRDAANREWVVKFGREAKPDTFGSRLAWAMGYVAQTNYYVPDGVIHGVKGLGRAASYVNSRGVFSGGRFQLRTGTPVMVEGKHWLWDRNPFSTTPELNGLRILMMVLSNWDNKDQRDVSRGSNTSVLQDGGDYLYIVDDWGGSMGSWGKLLTRSKWNQDDFSRQSPKMVREVVAKDIEFGYRGQHSASVTEGIRVADVRWLMQYLGRLTDDQIRTGLLASGATEAEAQNYGRALRVRIEALREVANSPQTALPSNVLRDRPW